jgi:hypothetical protein
MIVIGMVNQAVDIILEVYVNNRFIDRVITVINILIIITSISLFYIAARIFKDENNRL